MSAFTRGRSHGRGHQGSEELLALNYQGQPPVLGLHNGMGPPSRTVIMGAAIAVYVHTNPTIRNSILTARFMGLFSLRAGPLGAGNPYGHALYPSTQVKQWESHEGETQAPISASGDDRILPLISVR